jgi:hypothetical protein
LEVLALKVPFRNLLVVSESSPVAGAIKGFNPYKSLDAGRARELQKSAQPATQMLSVNCLYQMNLEKRKGEFEKGGSLPDWSGSGPWISDWALVAGIGRMYRVWPVSLAPPGLDDFSPTHPRLAPWAAFFRSFGAAAFSIPDLK